MKDNIEKQSMSSFESLSKTLDTETWTMDTEAEGKTLAGVEATETTKTVDLRGENKAPMGKRSRRKKNAYKKKNSERKQTEQSTSERKPRYFCEF